MALERGYHHAQEGATGTHLAARWRGPGPGGISEIGRELRCLKVLPACCPLDGLIGLSSRLD